MPPGSEPAVPVAGGDGRGEDLRRGDPVPAVAGALGPGDDQAVAPVTVADGEGLLVAADVAAPEREDVAVERAGVEVGEHVVVPGTAVGVSAAAGVRVVGVQVAAPPDRLAARG